jgi:hypothetical protein
MARLGDYSRIDLPGNPSHLYDFKGAADSSPIHF